MLNRPDTPPGFVVAEGKPVIVDDYASETRFHVPPTYFDAGVASGIAVPLSDRGRTVGALTVRSRQAQKFGQDEVRFLESLSSLLATSLQRAHTEEQLNHAQARKRRPADRGIAHDFNNLLTVISGNLQVLEELPAVSDDGVAPQMVGAMRATKRAAELTGKLLASPAPGSAAKPRGRQRFAELADQHAAPNSTSASRSGSTRSPTARPALPIPVSSNRRC